MVFSVNSVETGPNNFGAFQAAAKQQNGTGTPSSSSASPSGTGTGSKSANSGVSITQVNRGAGITIAFVSAAFGLLLF